MDAQRRNFLRGRFSANKTAVLLPWLKSSREFYSQCSRCMECQSSCPENIIATDDYGYPQINFKYGECVFCGECTKACPASLFVTDLNTRPWKYIASFGNTCLTIQGVSCQSCQDSCESRAIRFRYHVGLSPQPSLTADACTGCGACVSVCPTFAISIQAAAQTSTKKETLNVS